MNDRDLDARLAAALRDGRETPVPGFADRAVAAVRRDRSRRRLVRWVAVAAPLAACLALALAPGSAGVSAEDELRRLADLVNELEVGVPPLDDSEGLARLADWGA